MGCIQSRPGEELLLRPTLPVIYDDHVWGPIYMSSDLSRYIRQQCVGMNITQVHRFMQQFPQLNYEVGQKDLAYKRIYNSPNHIRFCIGPDEKVLLVIYG